MSISHLFLRAVLGRRLPVTCGEVHVDGITSPITIRRDQYGIPHIDAASDADAAFALGFCQGQDRGGLLEFLLRTARGRLAEWVGPLALTADRVSRRIGFRRAAEKQVAALEPHVRQALEMFALGISAGTTRGLSRKPHEFALLGGEPSTWELADVLAVLKLQSFFIPSNWDVELARLRILLADGPKAVQDLDPVRSVSSEARVLHEHLTNRMPHDSAASAAIDALAADLAALQSRLPRGGGSNNWVIAGSRTQSGKPLLASDPHLAPTAPPPWYLAHVRTPQWQATGASMTGTPGFSIGHNGFAAWGVTAGLTDNTDLFIETLSDNGAGVREADGTFTPCSVVREVIPVKGQADVIEQVLITPRGPLLSPVLPDLPVAFSIRAVWLDPLPIVGFLGVEKARSFGEFRSCFDRWPLLPLNVAYADIQGDIGWFLIGQLPERGSGNGLMPTPATQPDSGWTGLKPFAEMPKIHNPAQGWWATANNDPLAAMDMLMEPPGAGWSAFQANGDGMRNPREWLGVDYCDDYRVQAIREALAAREGWTVEDCMRLQRDLRCMPWLEIRETLLALVPENPDAEEALELLRGWDGRLDVDSPAAATYELFVAELASRLAKVRAPKSWRIALGEVGLFEGNLNLFADRRVGHLVQLIRDQPERWFDSWPKELLDVLGSVVRKLRMTVGPSPAFWGWGHLRQLQLEHVIFGHHRWLGPVFNIGPFPCGGDCNTISQAGARPCNPTDFTHNMCNLRTVFDLNDLSQSRFVLCGGQSGNPWSPHFADQLPLWLSGEAIAIAWHQADTIREAKETLRLIPESTGIVPAHVAG